MQDNLLMATTGGVSIQGSYESDIITRRRTNARLTNWTLYGWVNKVIKGITQHVGFELSENRPCLKYY